MNEVDYIGKKSVGEAIKLSKLTKFIIFQQGATRGSTPVFRCTEAKTIEKAQRSFEDWADSILRVNQNNNRAYEILLFSARTSEVDIEASESEERDKGTKTDKIRFSFSLNPYNNMAGGYGMGGANVEELVKKAIGDYEKDQRLLRLEAEIKELREGGNDSEEEEEESAISKVSNLIKLIRQGDFKQVSGEKDVPDVENDSEADVLEDEGKDSEKEQRMERLKISLNRIKKLDPEWKGLLKLSEMAKKDPKMFKSYMSTLMKMKF